MARLPHVEYSILWILSCGVGLAAGYAFYHSFRWDLAIASLIAIFFLAMFQHCVHVLSGASTTLRPEDFGVRKLKALAALFGGLAAACGAYIVYYRPWAVLGIAAGFAFVLAYAYPRIHIEELWGLGWAVGMPTAMYIAAGTLTLGPAIFMAGLGYLGASILIAYRCLTGDYDCDLPNWVLRQIVVWGRVPFKDLNERIVKMSCVRRAMLKRAVLSYILALLVMILGLALW